MWTGLGLGIIKIMQNIVDWAWALFGLNKKKEKKKNGDKIDFEFVTIKYN